MNNKNSLVFTNRLPKVIFESDDKELVKRKCILKILNLDIASLDVTYLLDNYVLSDEVLEIILYEKICFLDGRDYKRLIDIYRISEDYQIKIIQSAGNKIGRIMQSKYLSPNVICQMIYHIPGVLLHYVFMYNKSVWTYEQLSDLIEQLKLTDNFNCIDILNFGLYQMSIEDWKKIFKDYMYKINLCYIIEHFETINVLPDQYIFMIKNNCKGQEYKRFANACYNTIGSTDKDGYCFDIIKKDTDISLNFLNDVFIRNYTGYYAVKYIINKYNLNGILAYLICINRFNISSIIIFFLKFYDKIHVTNNQSNGVYDKN